MKQYGSMTGSAATICEAPAIFNQHIFLNKTSQPFVLTQLAKEQGCLLCCGVVVVMPAKTMQPFI